MSDSESEKKEKKDKPAPSQKTGKGEKQWLDSEYGLEGFPAFINKHIFNLGMCFDKTERTPWNIHICQTCVKVPQYYVLGCCCPCCFAFYQRELLLGYEMETRYSCCQGAYGKCWCTPCIRKIPCMPHLCLALESICCTSCSIAGNRTAMKFLYPRADTITETIIMIVGAILSFLGFFASFILCLTNGCLNSQQENEYVKEEGHTGLLMYADWGEKPPGVCYKDCFYLQPCCGEQECNVMDGLYCFACWFCCAPCSSAKLLAYSLDQDCYFINHCGPFLLVILLSWIPIISFCSSILSLYLNGAIRHNIRVQQGVGNAEHCFGDALLSNLCCTAPCSCCQELRSVPIEGWDWVGDLKKRSFNMINKDYPLDTYVRKIAVDK